MTVGGEELIRVHHTADVTTTADRDALAADVGCHVTLNAVVHYPVLAPIGVNPDVWNVTLA